VIRTLRVLLLLISGGVLLLLLALLILHAGADARLVNSLAGKVIPGTRASVTDVAGNYFSGLELRGVRIVRSDGVVLLHCDTVRIGYSLRQLLSDRLTIGRIRLIGPVVSLYQSDSGSWKLFPPRPKKPPGPPGKDRGPVIQEFSIDRGIANFRSVRYQAPLTVRFSAQGSLDMPLLTVRNLIVKPDSSMVLASGAVSLPGRGRPLELMELELETNPLVFRELRSFLPELDRPGGARLKAAITGPEPHATIDGVLYDIDPTPVLGSRSRAQPMRGRVSVDVQGKSLPRLRGNTRLELSGGIHTVRADAELDQGRARVVVAGKLGIVAGRITGWLRPFDGKPAYDLNARLQLPNPGALLKDTRWLGNSQREVALRVRAEGLPPHNAVGVATVRLGASGAALLDSASVKAWLRGRSAEIESQVGLASGTLRLEGVAGWGSPLKLRITRGTIANLNLAALLGEPRLKPLDGRFSLELGAFPARLQLKASSELNDAQIKVKALARLGGPRRRLNISELRFSQFDLQRFVSTQHSANLTGAGSLQAVGRNLKTGLVTGEVRLENSRIDQRELRQARLLVRLNQGTVLADGEIGGGSGRLAFSGSARPFDRRPSFILREASFTDLDLGSLLQKERFRTRVSGSLTSEGSGKNLKSARLVGKLDLRQSFVGGATIDSGRIEAGLDDGELRLIGRLSSGSDSAVIGAALSRFEQRPRVTLVTLVPIAHLASVLQPQLAPDAEGAALLAVSGELGSPDSMRLQAEVQANGRLGDLQLDSLGASVRLRNGVVHLDSLSLRSNVGGASGTGTMGLFGNSRAGPVGFRFAARVADLAPMAPYLGMAHLELDSGEIRVTAAGRSDSVQVALDLNTAGLAVGARRAAHLTVTADGQLSGSRLVSGTAELSAREIRSGKSSLQSIFIQGSGRGRDLNLWAEAVADARNKARLAARVSPEGRSTRVRLDTLIARVDHRRWALTGPAEISYGERIRVDDFRLSSGSRSVTLNGVIDPHGEQSFDVAMDSLRLLPMALALGLEELDGVLNGSASLRGPARSPRLRAEWDVAVNSRGRAAGTSGGRVGWGSDGLKLDAWVSPPQGDSLTLRGQFPLAFSLSSGDSGRALISRIPGGQLALDARARDVEIKKFQPLLDPEQVRNLRGKLSVDARARGTLDAPQLSGSVSLREAHLQIPSLGATYRSHLKLRLSGQEVRFEQGLIRGNKGQMDLTGTVRLQAFPTLAFDLRSRVQNFRAASSNAFRAGLTGDLSLTGSGKAPMLTGSLQLHDTDFYLQAKNLQSSAEPVDLSSEDLRILERRFGAEVAERSRHRRALLSNWGLGLDVSLSHNNWLRRRTDPVMAVELGGKVQVRKAPGEEIQLFGEIRPLVGRSFVQLMSRRFDLKSGDVTLNGPLNQVRLGLEAEYITTEAGGSTPVVITAAVQSDTGKLDVKLGSRPVMSSADIASYLTTGRPASTDPTLESDEQDVATMGASLAFGAALGSVAGIAGQRIGLDVIQVLQDRQGGQTVVGGKYVSPPLYLGFRQSIVPPAKNDRSTTSQQEAVEFEVEYAALRQLLLNIQGGGSDLRVFLRLRR
jgi:translocation and assembly module TamB